MTKDEAEIRDLVAQYADCVCRRDESGWGATWAEEGEWHLPGTGAVSGREAIVTMWLAAMAQFPMALQVIHNGTIKIAGDRATGRWYLAEHLQTGPSEGRSTIGCYQDRYVRTKDGWKFQERHYSVLYSDDGKGGMQGTAFDPPDLLFDA